MVKGKKILITRPEHDFGTKYLSTWTKEITETAKKKGFDVIDLHREKAEQKEFEGRVNKTDPSLIMLNGHGNENIVTGHDNKTIVEKGKNEELLKKRITYTVSCDSAKNLGESCADDNTAYIGYEKSFILNL